MVDPDLVLFHVDSISSNETVLSNFISAYGESGDIPGP